MNNFRNTFRVKTSELLSFPIKEGQTYFDTERNLLYRDLNQQRFVLGEFLSVEEFDKLNQEEFEKISNKLLIDEFVDYLDTGKEYRLWYVDPSGKPIDLGFGNTSAGAYKEPTLSMTVDNTGFIVNACCVNLYTNQTLHGPIRRFFLEQKTFLLSSMTVNTPHYVVARYVHATDEAEMVLLNSVATINESDVVPLFSVYKASNNSVHRLTWDALGAGLPNKLHQRLVRTNRFARESGLTPSNPNGLRVKVDEGFIYYGAAREYLSTFDSSSPTNHTLILLHRNISGEWVVGSPASSALNNVVRDSATGLVPLNNNQYSVAWIFRGVTEKIPVGQPDVYYILSNMEYSNPASARTATMPAPPSFLPVFATLVAKAILQQGNNNVVEFYSLIESSSVSSGGAAVSIHNDLTGRDAENSHPITAIAGLQSELNSKVRKETPGWIIENESNDFKIKQNNIGLWAVSSFSPTALSISQEPVIGAKCYFPGTDIYEYEGAYYICNLIADEDIISIYKEPQTSGGVTDAKVSINAKTTISELDFGGW